MIYEPENKTIVVLARYIANPEQVEYLTDLGLDSFRLIQYRYREKTVYVDEIMSVIKYKGNDYECGIRLSDGSKITVKEHPDSLFIRINDVKNGTIEDPTKDW